MSIGYDPEIEKEEIHQYNGADFRILYFHRNVLFSRAGFQRLLIFFKTPDGTVKSELQVSIDLMENEPTWKDMMCSEAWESYKRKNK